MLNELRFLDKMKDLGHSIKDGIKNAGKGIAKGVKDLGKSIHSVPQNQQSVDEPADSDKEEDLTPEFIEETDEISEPEQQTQVMPPHENTSEAQLEITPSKAEEVPQIPAPMKPQPSIG